MPVVVVGASGFVGRRAVEAFVTTSPEVRAYVRHREAADQLRAMGAKVAVGEITDVDNLEAVMADAHTVCHLVGGVAVPVEELERANLGSVRAVLEATVRTGVRRILFLSSPGASPDASNAYLRLKGLAEQDVAASGIGHVVLRCTHVYGPGSPWLRLVSVLARRRPAVVIGSGRQVIAPVFVGDVVRVLAAADDRRRMASGVWGLEGPDRVRADDLVPLLGGRDRPRIHAGSRLAGILARRGGRNVSTVEVDLLAGDSVADRPDAAPEFGVERTSLREGLKGSLPE